MLSEKCYICGSKGREFVINNPGDIRPCMGDSVDMILSLFKNAFGTSSPINGKAIFFNKIAGEDRADEVIVNGSILAVVRFDIVHNKMVLEIKQPGAEMFNNIATKNIVVLGKISGHIKRKTISGENIISTIGSFSAGETLIIRKGTKIGTGIAIENSTDIHKSKRAIKVYDINFPSYINTPVSADMQTFVNANSNHIIHISKLAIKEIKNFLASKDGKRLPITVSFSGGKDSLVAYWIATETTNDLDLIYINTGLEFPETIEYVKKFSDIHNNKLHIVNAGNTFWDNINIFGPPAKDFRWCCKLCKLGPIADMISNVFPKGTITIEGNRRLESYTRSKIGFITRNPFVPNQINLNPIRSWCAAEVWGCIFLNNLQYNELYNKDFERIGCYLCPSCLSSEW